MFNKKLGLRTQTLLRLTNLTTIEIQTLWNIFEMKITKSGLIRDPFENPHTRVLIFFV